MYDTVLQYCKKEKLIEKDDYVLAGVSGGADSVCMLLLLEKLQKEIGFSLEAVHVEHGIRGAESEQDAAFVTCLCKEHGIPLQVFYVQAKKFAKEQKIGLEEAARILRYDCYEKAAGKMSGVGVKVALAHHADDNAETVLFQMVRGSGIDGLSGMSPRRKLKEGAEVIRPLLSVTRAEIEGFLRKVGQEYCVDSTNEDVAYSRNRIRHEVLPLLERVNVRAVAHINQSAMLLREVGAYLKMQVEEAAGRVLKAEQGGLLILWEELNGLPEIIKKEVLHLAIGKAAQSAKDIGIEHVELVAELFTRQVGRSAVLPYHVRARRVYEGVLLEKEGKEEKSEGFYWEISQEEFEQKLQQEGYELEISDAKMLFRLEKVVGEYEEISKNTYTKSLDYDKIKGRLQIRTRQAGDYLVVDDAGHRKRLKEYFVNEKIPSKLRNEILLLAQGSKVIWVIGGRISADVKITKHTKQILKVQITGGKYHEN